MKMAIPQFTRITQLGEFVKIGFKRHEEKQICLSVIINN
jgi:hypothetical protein